jgi:cholesterol oxidase
LGSCIQTGAFVTHIGPTSDGYRVHFVDLDTQERREVTGRRVIISAGTLGTNEILLRSRDVNKTLPLVSRRLGVGYSANGDFLGSIQNSATDLHSWTGPDVTSVIRYFDSAPEFTMAAPTFNRPAMTVLASMGQPNVRWLRFLSPLLWPLMNQLLPLILKLGLLSRPSSFKARNAGDPARMTNLFAIGRDDANGVMSLKCGRLDIAWDYARQNEVLVRRMTEAMEKIADTYGGAFSPLPTWNLFNRIITVHSLGGCHLSDSPQQGVVSPRGEVHGYPGLYVADGSVIPTAIGFHPVMTISAVSEHIAEAVVASYSG